MVKYVKCVDYTIIPEIRVYMHQKLFFVHFPLNRPSTRSTHELYFEPHTNVQTHKNPDSTLAILIKTKKSPTTE